MKQEPKYLQPKDFQFGPQTGVTKLGIIYLAMQRQTQTPLTVKLLHTRKYESPQMHSRIKKEIQIHSRLKHPHIAELYCYMHHGCNIYLVSEYCPKNLMEIKINNSYIMVSEIARLMIQLLTALDYLEKRWVIHRNVKLENLLLDEKGNLKLANFDSCVHAKWQQEQFFGAIEYMAPQMLLSKLYNHKVDIYSAGVVFYKLFYWSHPFEGATKEEAIEAIKANKVEFTDNVRLIPQCAKDLIREMLSQEPEKRPTAEDALKHKFFKEYNK